MMKKIIFSLLCILFAFSNLLSQSDSTFQELTDKEIDEIILNIRDRYKQINKIKSDSVDYLNEIDYHVTQINWADTTEGFPGVGHKHSFFKFYWANGKLIKLVHSNAISVYGVYKEYIFDENQNLIFYFEKNFVGVEEYEERIYYNKSQLIHYQIKPLSLGDKNLEIKDYSLKDFNEKHFARAQYILKESDWRIYWFDHSAPGLDMFYNE